jgi:hypothetical protein
MANIIIYQELVDHCEIFISKMAMNLFYIVFILSSNNDNILHVHSNMSDTAGVLYEAEIVYLINNNIGHYSNTACRYKRH